MNVGKINTEVAALKTKIRKISHLCIEVFFSAAVCGNRDIIKNIDILRGTRREFKDKKTIKNYLNMGAEPPFGVPRVKPITGRVARLENQSREKKAMGNAAGSGISESREGLGLTLVVALC